MLCSLCMERKSQMVKLSCGHDICYGCLPRFNPLQRVIEFQCQTCLKQQKIDLAKVSDPSAPYRQFSCKEGVMSSNEQDSSKYNSSSSEILFCWDCSDSITIQGYLKGKHQGHSVQTLEQALPSLKDRVLEQLEQSMTISQFLKERIASFETHSLNSEFERVICRVEAFMEKQHDFIDQKKKQMIGDLTENYTVCIRNVEKQLELLRPAVEQIDFVTRNMSDFLMDRLSILDLESIQAIAEQNKQFVKNIKLKKFEIPQLPLFIEKSSIKQSIEDCCSVAVKTVSRTPSIGLFNLGPQQPPKLSAGQETPIFIERKKRAYQLPGEVSSQKRGDMNVRNVQLQEEFKKVKLVQRLKGKMKYGSSLCSTSAF